VLASVCVQKCMAYIRPLRGGGVTLGFFVISWLLCYQASVTQPSEAELTALMYLYSVPYVYSRLYEAFSY